MSFQPQVNQEIAIENQPYRVAAHPAAPALPYGQEGRQAVVYQLAAGSERRALKVFKSRFQVPALVTLADRLGAFAGLPGLQVCRRTVLTPQRHAVLLRQSPDLLYAVLMPWIPGPTWMEVLLQGTALTPEQSLHLARTLAEVLAGMEQRGVAHCDLSGPNVILPALDGAALRNPPCAIQLVDVEQFYGPGLDRPAALPSGSAGYAHAAAAQGLAAPDADRFAGAVLLAEMLGWCDPRVCSAAWGESYFDPAEMQRPGERLQTLDAVLRERWGAPVARLFAQAWSSEALADCPPFGAWLLALPDSVPAPAKASAPQPAAAEAAQTPAMPEAVQVLLSLAGDFAAQGNAASACDTYRRALALLPAGSSMAQELALIIRALEPPPPVPVPPAPARPRSRPWLLVGGAILLLGMATVFAFGYFSPPVEPMPAATALVTSTPGQSVGVNDTATPRAWVVPATLSPGTPATAAPGPPPRPSIATSLPADTATPARAPTQAPPPAGATLTPPPPTNPPTRPPPTNPPTRPPPTNPPTRPPPTNPPTRPSPTNPPGRPSPTNPPPPPPTDTRVPPPTDTRVPPPPPPSDTPTVWSPRHVHFFTSAGEGCNTAAQTAFPVQATVYAQFSMDDSVAGTRVQVIWSGGALGYTRTDAQTVDVHKPVCVSGFALDTSQPPIGPGTYTVSLRINGVDYADASFTVAAPPPTNTPTVWSPHHVRFFTSAGEGCSATPQTAFPTQATVYAQVSMDDSVDGTRVQVVWSGGVQGYTHTDAQTVDAHKPVCVSGFALDTSRPPIGPGTYSVSLVINGVDYADATFTVAGSPPINTPPPLPSPTNRPAAWSPHHVHFFTSAGEGCNTAAQTGFPVQATVYAQFSMDDSVAGTRVQVIWSGGALGYTRTDAQTVGAHEPVCVSGFALDTSRPAIGPGTYTVSLRINGIYYGSVAFTVSSP